MNVHHWNYSIYEFCKDVSKWCPSGLGYKKHSSTATSYFFLFMFPIYSPFGQEHPHLLSYNEASFGLCLSGLNPLSFDPSTNNDPLQFNGSSGPLVTECPPLENNSENAKKRKRASLPPGTDSCKTFNTLPPASFVIKDGLNVSREFTERAERNFILTGMAVRHFWPAWFIGKRISSCVWRSDSCSGTTAPLRLCVFAVCCLTNATCSSNGCTPSARLPPPANADPSRSHGNTDSFATFRVCTNARGSPLTETF